MWPQRSRHFLRIGKRRFVTLLLLTDVKHFEQSTLDIVLSVLYDRLPQELTPGPQDGDPLVVSPYHLQRPYRYSSEGLEFSYYWVAPTTEYSIVAPRAKPAVLDEGDFSSKDKLLQVNQTLVVCVHAAPKSSTYKEPDASAQAIEEDPLIDLGVVARPTTLDQFIVRKSSSSNLTGASSQSSQPDSAT